MDSIVSATAAAAGMIIMASSHDDSGKTTGVFIASSKLADEPCGLTTDRHHQNVVSDAKAVEIHRPLGEVGVDTDSAIVVRKRRGILKPPKAICFEALASLPPPIQRSARLSPRELRRLTPLPIRPSDGPSRTVKLRFDSQVQVLPVDSGELYNRGSCEFEAKCLTPALAMAIKKELNEVKREMEVHEESRENTQFYRV